MSATDRLSHEVDKKADALGTLLERSLGGDGAALEVLVALLRTRHYKTLLDRLHRTRKQASTQTLEDAFQDSILQLVDKVKSGELRDLPEERREDVLGYFFKLCDRRIADLHRPRLSPVLAMEKEDVPTDLIDSNARIPGDHVTTDRHRDLLRSAVLRLGPEDRLVLEEYLKGASHKEIAEQVGKKACDVANQIARLKQRLLLDIAPRSATARLKYEAERATPLRKPSREELKAAVEQLPLELAEAVRAIHFEKITFETFAKSLKSHGDRKAASRLKQAYRLLSTKLRADFPSAFDEKVE